MNTVPGLTNTSILPQQAAAAGISLSELFENNLTELKTMFSELIYKQTESELTKIGNERAKLLFG